VTFTRTGGAILPASSAGRATRRYRFTDGSLVRDHWLSVDPALNSEPRQRVC
jgi:hypothetical protein